MQCSKCENPAAHSILVRADEPKPKPHEKDRRGIFVFRFCKKHWAELEKCLP